MFRLINRRRGEGLRRAFHARQYRDIGLLHLIALIEDIFGGMLISQRDCAGPLPRLMAVVSAAYR